MKNQITNGDRLAWTRDQDEFIKQYAALPHADLASAITKRFNVLRTPGSIQKRKQRLRKMAAKQYAQVLDPQVSVTMGGVKLVARVSPYRLTQVINLLNFDQRLSKF